MLFKKLFFLWFLSFISIASSEASTPSDTFEGIEKRSISTILQNIYAKDEVLKNTWTYKGLMAADVLSTSYVKYVTLGPLSAFEHGVSAFMQHNSPALILKIFEKVLPENIQKPFCKIITLGLHAYNFYNYPQQQALGYTFGLSGAFLAENLLNGSSLRSETRREYEALIYYLLKKAGWSTVELLNKNIPHFYNREDLFPEDTCSLDQKMDPANGTQLPKCKLHPCQDPEISKNIQEGYSSLGKCISLNGTEEEECLKNYIQELPNYAYSPDVWKCLYQTQPVFIAQGGYSRLYRVKLINKDEPVALKAFIKSTYGESPKTMTHYIRETRRIEDYGKGLSDFIPKIYGIYFGAIPEDISSIALYEGTRVNQGVFPKEARGFLPRGGQTGHVPENVSIRYHIKGYNDIKTSILPVLFTHFEFIKGGTLKNQKLSLSMLLEIGLMEFIFLKNNFSNGDLHSGNIGIQPVDYGRAYYVKGVQSLENNHNLIYLMKGENSPKILDLDQSRFRSFNDGKAFIPEAFLRLNPEQIYDDNLIDRETYSLINNIRKNGFFSQETRKYLLKYSVSEDVMKDQEQKGLKIRRYS